MIIHKSKEIEHKCHTQAKIVNSIGDGINLKILPIIIASKIDGFSDKSTACKWLIDFLSIDLQTWQLIHWHTFLLTSKERVYKNKTGKRKDIPTIFFFVVLFVVIIGKKKFSIMRGIEFNMELSWNILILFIYMLAWFDYYDR